MKHISAVGKKITIQVKYIKTFTYKTHVTYYGETHFIHKLVDEEGNEIVWNTTAYVEDKKVIGECGIPQHIWEGSILDMTATVKEHSEYNGVPQTVITRPKFTLVHLAESPDEKQNRKEAEKELKKQEQLQSITENDLVWEMPYSQYKEHYSDCETVIDSYEAHDNRPATIKVIVREGRLKNSGVRGEHFHSYKLKNEFGQEVIYRAVSPENAIKRANKEFGGHTWEWIGIIR